MSNLIVQPTRECRRSDTQMRPAQKPSSYVAAQNEDFKAQRRFISNMLSVTQSSVLPFNSPPDVVQARLTIGRLAQQQGFSQLAQTKLVTAVSELARNALIHGGGGLMRWNVVVDGGRGGLRLTFEDRGPGISDITLALTDGWTSGGGLGLGLPGARRLVHEFEIHSVVGEGTQVTITYWK